MLNLLFKKLAKIDWLLFLAVFILLSVGLAAILSVQLSQGGYDFLEKQLIASGLGLVLCFTAAVLNIQFFRAYSRLLYIVGVVLLAGLFLFGVELNGTTGWYIIGGFAFQPVEVMKFALILELARYFSDEARSPFGWRELLGSGSRAMLPVFLVLLQPDLGSALLLCGIFATVVFFAGMPWQQIILLLLCGTLAFAMGWFLLFKDYQRDRILTFLNPTADPRGAGYNIVQAEIAIGAGGILGAGLGGGSQSQLRFLPQSQSDFIFAVIAEELGFVGVMLLLAALSLFLWRILFIAGRSKDYFSSFLALGAFGLFFMQSFVHIGANLALMPATGVPLPFVSYGGTSLLLSFLVLGAVESGSKSADTKRRL